MNLSNTAIAALVVVMSAGAQSTVEHIQQPARSAVQVAALAIPGPLVEIEAIAVKPR